jgi:hypothetical protein
MKRSILLTSLTTLLLSTLSFARGPLSAFDPAVTNPRVQQEMTYDCGILDVGHSQFNVKVILGGALSQVIYAPSSSREMKLILKEQGSYTPYEQTLYFSPLGTKGIFAHASGGTGISLMYSLQYTDRGVLLKREVQEEGDIYGRVDLENICRVTKVRN